MSNSGTDSPSPVNCSTSVMMPAAKFRYLKLNKMARFTTRHRVSHRLLRRWSAPILMPQNQVVRVEKRMSKAYTGFQLI